MNALLSRRELLRLAGFSGASYALPVLLSGCGGDDPKARKDKSLPPPDYTQFDPNEPWWHQGNYAAVDGEVEAFDLEVDGALPPSLDGLYVRNGSNSKTNHWFLGDGMIHGVRLENGRASWYRRRYIKTTVHEGTANTGVGPPNGPDNQSNVAVVHHGERLLTLGEVGFPYELRPDDLSTVGAYDFDGALTTSMTAHPKLDPVTGEMLMFGYWFVPPYLTYHQVDASGKLVRSVDVDVPGPAMMHDFAMTATRAVFMDLPITFDISLVSEGMPFKWNPDYGARFGVMPRNGGNADVVWFEIPDCYVFHTMNAYDDPVDPNVVVLEAVRHEKLWQSGPSDFETSPTLHRWRLDLTTGKAAEQKLDDFSIEFPQLDRRLLGRAYRYGYTLHLGRSQGDGVILATTGVLKYDHKTGSREQLELPAGLQPDEAVFVPENESSGEDEGWLMAYAYDHRTQKTDLLLLDAHDLGKGIVARVKLPYRVPFGFHGIWLPS